MWLPACLEPRVPGSCLGGWLVLGSGYLHALVVRALVVGRLVVGGYLCALLVGVSLVGVLGGGYLHALELVPWLVCS